MPCCRRDGHIIKKCLRKGRLSTGFIRFGHRVGNLRGFQIKTFEYLDPPDSFAIEELVVTRITCNCDSFLAIVFKVGNAFRAHNTKILRQLPLFIQSK